MQRDAVPHKDCVPGACLPEPELPCDNVHNGGEWNLLLYDPILDLPSLVCQELLGDWRRHNFLWTSSQLICQFHTDPPLFHGWLFNNPPKLRLRHYRWIRLGWRTWLPTFANHSDFHLPCLHNLHFLLVYDLHELHNRSYRRVILESHLEQGGFWLSAESYNDIRVRGTLLGASPWESGLFPKYNYCAKNQTEP